MEAQEKAGTQRRCLFACKTKGGKSYGSCAFQDDLTLVLTRIRQEASVIILGSPLYLAAVSGAMKCFMGRLIFPWLPYEAERSTLFPRKMPVGALYAMNVPKQVMKERNYHGHIANNEDFLKRVFGSCETLCSFNTYQFDYSKMAANRFDVEEKIAQRRDVFPSDCQKAFAMGARLASESLDPA